MNRSIFGYPAGGVGWDVVHSEVRRGYEVELALAPEEDAPDICWERYGIGPANIKQLMGGIECGELLWFMARVRAKDQGQVLAENYLSGCCYASVEEFRAGGYFEDMVDEVLSATTERKKDENHF